MNIDKKEQFRNFLHSQAGDDITNLKLGKPSQSEEHIKGFYRGLSLIAELTNKVFLKSLEIDKLEELLEFKLSQNPDFPTKYTDDSIKVLKEQLEGLNLRLSSNRKHYNLSL